LIICPNKKVEKNIHKFPSQQCTQLYNLFLKNLNLVQKKVIWILLLNNISMTIFGKIKLKHMICNEKNFMANTWI